MSKSCYVKNDRTEQKGSERYHHPLDHVCTKPQSLSEHGYAIQQNLGLSNPRSGQVSLLQRNMKKEKI